MFDGCSCVCAGLPFDWMGFLDPVEHSPLYLPASCCTQPDHLTDLLYRVILYIAGQLRGMQAVTKLE